MGGERALRGEADPDSVACTGAWRVRMTGTRAVLAAASALVILAGGCAAGRSAGSAVPDRRTSQPSHSPAAPVLTGVGRRALASRYMAIAVPANHRLDTEVNGFADHQRHDLAAAESYLRAEAATERWFDRRLVGIAFPPAIASIAGALIGANRHRIALTEREALSATIAGLRSFASGHRSADAAVEVQVRLIRRALGLPPPSDS